MPRLMRCKYCGTLQDEPSGAKVCVQCGGELGFEDGPAQKDGSCVRAQLELDQMAAPAEQIVERYLVVGESEFTVETPGAVLRSEQANTASGREGRGDPAPGFVAVLDVSGSMCGAKIRAAREAIRQAMGRF